MYCPPVFRESNPSVLRRIIRDHPLATLVTFGSSGLIANLVPFHLVQGSPDLLRAHLAKGNDQSADLREGCETLVVFQGEQAYVTPNWYATKQEDGRVVPTWNYVLVQARGRPRIVDDHEWLRSEVEALTRRHERGRSTPWSVDDAPTSFIQGRLKAIVGLEISVERLEGKWKTSQNQPEANRSSVAAGLREADSFSPMATLVEGVRTTD